MPRYIITRVLYTLPVIWLVVSTVFLLIHFVPGDPIQQMLGEGAAAGDIQAARHAYGLDIPLGEQYLERSSPRRSRQVPPLQPGSY
jgi:peptide/nickel transport system permease protein